MLVALLIDLAIGWSAWLFARLSHPVVWVGALITFLEHRLNSDAHRHANGALAVALTVSAAVLPAGVIQWLLPGGWVGLVATGILAWPLVAARSLHDHVEAVARPLVAGDLEAARRAVAMIVGRDPNRLDQAGIARAALESLAENASDGVAAPLFWGAVFGLPGIAGYKAINTLDSMIGHRSARYAEFGMVAARLDDLVNLIPARLTGLSLALVSGRPGPAFTTMRRDARRHRSPNAGWPEAALAGGLGVRLSGPRLYAEGVADEPWLNGDAADPTPEDLSRGLGLYRRAVLLWLAALAALALI
ncbi:adenosylcobinamide-phosphate synthase CbiB [Litorisediminicola beolgyonensis]|uniref:Cobalamin biosynthesis protein CobD n=1 Tax=Litorisediminicola beolgyonensis TaxID=1173614 RepID=A0ABW3ZHA5_9RHOB